jgi:hypothetical protein
MSAPTAKRLNDMFGRTDFPRLRERDNMSGIGKLANTFIATRRMKEVSHDA